MTSERLVPTPQGEARLVTDRARHPVATLLLSHGAGAGIDTRDLEALARHLPRHGVTVVRLEQPWKVAGRRIATTPASLDEALVAASDTLRVRTPLVVGGRSAGARSAVRCARHLGARGALALSFPLHPLGRPERSRLPELREARVPTLVIQGEKDPMGRPEEFPERPRDVRRARGRPRAQGAGSWAAHPGRRPSRSSWRPRWSGWCARSSAAAEPRRAVGGTGMARGGEVFCPP